MTYLTPHTVLNKEQAFMVMKYQTDLITSHMLPEMLLQPEKVSETMYLLLQKNYIMNAHYMDGRHEWLFKGCEKSDTMPFVNKILGFSRRYLHLRLAEGYELSKVFRALCLFLKKQLLAFINGEIPPAELAITKRLTNFKEEGDGGAGVHLRVAWQMKRRRENVGSGDLITFIKVLAPDGSNIKVEKTMKSTVNDYGYDVRKEHKSTKSMVESLDYVVTKGIPIDYFSIWKDIKKPLLAFFLHIAAPITDPVICNSIYPYILDKQIKERNRQEERQKNLADHILFKGPGDIEWRLNQRAHFKTGNNMSLQSVSQGYALQIYQECLSLRLNEMELEEKFFNTKHEFQFDCASECAICGIFFPDTILKYLVFRKISHELEDPEDDTKEYQKPFGNVDYRPKYSVRNSGQSELRICGSCIGKKDVKVIGLEKLYVERRTEFFEHRAYCTVCIKATEAPEFSEAFVNDKGVVSYDIEDMMLGSAKTRPCYEKNEKPFQKKEKVEDDFTSKPEENLKYDPISAVFKRSIPEDCTYVTCSVYIARKEALEYMKTYESKIKSLCNYS